MPKVEVEKLLEGLTLTDEQRKAFTEVYGNEANNTVAADRFMMRSDYSRQMDDLKAKETAAQTRMTEAEGYYQTLSEWQVEEKAKIQGMIDTEKRNWEAEKVRLQTELVSKGADPMQFREPEVKPPTAPDYTATDQRYLDRNTARDIAATAIDLPLRMPAIMATHQQLYGHINADWTGFQEAAKTNLLQKQIPVEDTAAQFFKFGEQRQKLADEALEARTTKMAEDKFTEMMSQAKVPGAQLSQQFSNDKIYSSDFADKSMKMAPDITEHERPETLDAALQDFLAVNKELEQQGVFMNR